MRDPYVNLSDEALLETLDMLLKAACDDRLTYKQKRLRGKYYECALAVAVSRGIAESTDQMLDRLSGNKHWQH
jgi:hypothetical protein